MFDNDKIICMRKDIKDHNWCSAEYMAKTIGLNVGDCQKFLDGPEMSQDHALLMTKKQADLFNNTLLTQEVENNVN